MKNKNSSRIKAADEARQRPITPNHAFQVTDPANCPGANQASPGAGAQCGPILGLRPLGQPASPGLSAITIPPAMTLSSDEPPSYIERVQKNFAQQSVMRLMGAELLSIHAGAVDVGLNWSEPLTQQHGFLHAGVLATVLDSTCGYAALSLMPPEADVLSIEFKINLLAPADAPRFRMEGRVVRAGRTITVTEGRAFGITHENGHPREKLVATMHCTLMTVLPRT
ncbi:PaaI family thioesterase [Allofranklinella schreckenbergeri]|uniref:Medium/long-chain acyl-CoA thioesterase YigI n=1 Tax=Allofranklinella schreckenbergeri TaxID=1076744 RepID=A0A3M6QHP3_9BURK|nr:PaaI family thioesterase [Allofranklinella schreckenbergeri]